MRVAVVHAINKFADKDNAVAITAVATRLDDTDWKVRQAAESAFMDLSSRGNRTALALLARCLEHQDVDVRLEAVNMCARISVGVSTRCRIEKKEENREGTQTRKHPNGSDLKIISLF